VPILNMEKLTAGLAGDWAGYVRDWDRTLRVATHPETTRYNYLLAAAQLARYLAEYSPDPEAIAAAEDPTAVRKAHVESFLAWMSETRSPSTALNKYKGLQQFFRWLLEDEEAIDRSPMDRVRKPRGRQDPGADHARRRHPQTAAGLQDPHRHQAPWCDLHASGGRHRARGSTGQLRIGRQERQQKPASTCLTGMTRPTAHSLWSRGPRSPRRVGPRACRRWSERSVGGDTGDTATGRPRGARHRPRRARSTATGFGRRSPPPVGR
jgi:hypothetical protein